MSLLAVNSHNRDSATVPPSISDPDTRASKKRKTALEKPPLDDHMIQSIISALPETEQIQKFVNGFLWQLHQDTDMQKFSDFFGKIIEINKEYFEPLAASDKVRVLFDFYKDRFIEFLIKKTEYQEPLNALKQKIAEDCSGKVVDKKIQTICREEMEKWHRTFITCAVADAIEISPATIDLSKNLSSRYKGSAMKFPEKCELF